MWTAWQVAPLVLSETLTDHASARALPGARLRWVTIRHGRGSLERRLFVQIAAPA